MRCPLLPFVSFSTTLITIHANAYDCNAQAPTIPILTSSSIPTYNLPHDRPPTLSLLSHPQAHPPTAP